jgi:hypothetical protein
VTGAASFHRKYENLCSFFIYSPLLFIYFILGSWCVMNACNEWAYAGGGGGGGRGGTNKHLSASLNGPVHLTSRILHQ